MKEFAALRPKMYSYLTNDDYVDKNEKSAKKCGRKREIKFEDYKNYLEKDEITLILQQMFWSVAHNLFIENATKITMSVSDNKILQTSDRVTTYPPGYG